MGGIWPEADAKQKKAGWRLNFKFLRAVKSRLEEVEGLGLPEEYIETVLISAALVEPDFLADNFGD